MAEETLMEESCPERCAKSAMQRTIDCQELSKISNRARAEIALLRETALICENCRSVYLRTADGTIHLGTLHSMGQWESERFPETLLSSFISRVRNSSAKQYETSPNSTSRPPTVGRARLGGAARLQK